MSFAARWKILSSVQKGDWESKALLVAQLVVGVVAVLGILGMLTLQPLFLLAFASTLGLMVLGIVLFIVVAVFSQRTMVLEEYDAKETIFREGDVGRHLYVIKSGSVEIVVRKPDGGEQVVRSLGAGEYFGEMALLGRAPRNATARTSSATQLLKMNRTSFATLYTNLPGLRDQFNKKMEDRLHELEAKK